MGNKSRDWSSLAFDFLRMRSKQDRLRARQTAEALAQRSVGDASSVMRQFQDSIDAERQEFDRLARGFCA
jgi:hypothetical protein